MSNLATITNNILADSGIDDINVIVSTGSYSNPAWITALAWTKITGAPANIVTGTGTTNVVPKFIGTSTIGDSAISDNTNEVSITKRLFLNTGGQSFTITPNLSGVSNRIESSSLPLEITTLGSALRLAAGGVTAQLTLASTGVVTLTNLAGTGSRIVTADASGNLSASSALSGYIQGSGTTNYLPKFTGTSTIGNSNLINDASGNLGLGVTPSAWGSALRVIQGPNSDFVFTSRYPYVLSNGFFDTSWKYVNSEGASFYVQAAGQHQWFNAPSGTAGNAISFTQAMTLTSGGNLLVGTTTDNGSRLQVNGGVSTGNNGLTVGGYNFYTQTISGAMGILGHNVRASSSVANQVDVVNGGWYSSMIKMYYSEGITFHTSQTSYSAGAVYPMAGTERMRIAFSGRIGMGTNDPIDQLHVAGGITSTGLANPTTTSVGSLQIGYDGTNGIIRTWNSSPLIFSNYNNQIFETSGAERFRISSTGFVSAGATTNGRLGVRGFTNDSSGYAFEAANASGNSLFLVRNDGNVGVGSTAPINKFAVIGSNNFSYYNRTDALAVFTSFQPTVLIAHDGNSDNQFAELKLGNNQTTYYPFSAYIRGVQGGGIDQYRLEFGTSASVAATTKMTITSSGNVLIGTTTDTGGVRLQVAASASSWIGATISGDGGTNKVVAGNYLGVASIGGHNSGLSAWTPLSINFGGGNVLIGTLTDAGYTLNVVGNAQFIKSTTSTAMVVGLSGVTGSIIRFSYNGGFVGSISTDGSNTAYNTSSDYRLKEQIRPIDNPLEKVLSLNPINFKYKNSKTIQDGFIAHEIQEILPYLVTGEKDGAEMQEVDYSKLTPILIAAIKELKQEIDKLRK